MVSVEQQRALGEAAIACGCWFDVRPKRIVGCQSSCCGALLLQYRSKALDFGTDESFRTRHTPQAQPKRAVYLETMSDPVCPQIDDRCALLPVSEVIPIRAVLRRQMDIASLPLNLWLHPILPHRLHRHAHLCRHALLCLCPWALFCRLTMRNLTTLSRDKGRQNVLPRR